MPHIKVLKPFKFAHGGIRVEEFEPGDDPVPATQELVDTLEDEGLFKVLKNFKEPAAPEPVAHRLLALLVSALPGEFTDPAEVVHGLRDVFAATLTSDDEANVHRAFAVQTSGRAARQARKAEPVKQGKTDAEAASAARKELDAALAELPGDYTDADQVVKAMRAHYAAAFADADEARIRELVKAAS